MNPTQAKLTRLFLGTATKARSAQGARDADLVPAMLAAAHAVAMRRDPTWAFIADQFEAADEGAERQP